MLDWMCHFFFPQVQQRSVQPALRSHARQAVCSVLGSANSQPKPVALSSGVTRGRCYLCVRDTHGRGHKKMKNKVRRQQQRCVTCCKHVCNSHCVCTKMCTECNVNGAANYSETD